MLRMFQPCWRVVVWVVAPRFSAVRVSGSGSCVVLNTTRVPAGRLGVSGGMRCQACALVFHVQMYGCPGAASCVLICAGLVPFLWVV